APYSTSENIKIFVEHVESIPFIVCTIWNVYSSSSSIESTGLGTLNSSKWSRSSIIRNDDLKDIGTTSYSKSQVNSSINAHLGSTTSHNSSKSSSTTSTKSSMTTSSSSISSSRALSTPFDTIEPSNEFSPISYTISTPESIHSLSTIESKLKALSPKERVDVPNVDCTAESSREGISLTIKSSMSSLVSRDSGCTWEMLKDLIREKYYLIYYRAEMERQFLSLRQGTRTVDEYEREFTRLAAF
ncbi:Unknown protein, partial [Striga hermonthica]